MKYRVVSYEPLRPPHWLVVAGRIASGKTRVCELLSQDYGYESVNTGALIADIIKIPPVPATPRSEFQAASHEFFSTRAGVVGLTERIISRCQELNSEKITIDGLRIPEVLAELRKNPVGRKVGVLFVEAPPEIARRFYEQREDLTMDYQSFLKMVNAPVESDITVMRSMADAIIVNDQVNLLPETVHALMQEIGVPRCAENGPRFRSQGRGPWSRPR